MSTHDAVVHFTAAKLATGVRPVEITDQQLRDLFDIAERIRLMDHAFENERLARAAKLPRPLPTSMPSSGGG